MDGGFRGASPLLRPTGATYIISIVTSLLVTKPFYLYIVYYMAYMLSNIKDYCFSDTAEDILGIKKYLVTIRAGALRYIPREDIEEIYNNLKKLKGYEWSDITGYELDKDGRWHFHTYCKGEKIPYLKGFSKNSLYVHFQENAHSDQNKIIKYITKEPQNRYELDAKDWESRAHYDYLFVD